MRHERFEEEMNFITLYYFVEVAKELNMTKAAHNLHITQQTLSFQIQKLEDYYGVTLFERKPVFRLTDAGELFFEKAVEILGSCDALMDQMAAVSKKCTGKLRIGISSNPAQVTLPMIVPRFMNKWENISLYFSKSSMVERIKDTLDGKIDICIGIYNGNDRHLTTEFLFDDHLYLVASSTLLQKYYGRDYTNLIESERKGTNLKAFYKLPFMKLSTSSHLGYVINEYMVQMRINPKIVIETQSLDISVSLASLDIGAFVCGRLRLTEILKSNPQLIAFPLSGHFQNSAHHFKLITLEGRNLPDYAADFIEITKDVFKSLDQYTYIN